MESSWKSMTSAPTDGTVFVGRYWQYPELPGGPFPGYVLMQWDEFEDLGWMDPEGLSVVDAPVSEWCPIPA